MKKDNKEKKSFDLKKLKEKIKELSQNKKVSISIPIILVMIFVILFGFKKPNEINNEKPSKLFSIDNIEKQSKSEYVNPNETFTVTTTKGSLDDVKTHLVIEPAVNYDINQVSKNEYEVVTKDIPSDKIINLKYVDNEVVDDKWAFQSTKDLKVTSVYPANNKSSIGVNSTIEIDFSYPNVEDINNSVVIEPKVDGKFVQNGRTWILNHSKPLKENQTYTITIKDDIKAGDKKLKESIKTTFSTYKSPDTSKGLNYNSITVDNIATFRTNENPMFITSKEIAKVEMLKFNSNDDFYKYISNETNYKIKTLGNVSFKKLNNQLYMINNKYQEGYYLEKAYYKNGQLSFSIPIQINNLQSYVISTQNDLLVWTSSNNKLIENVPVSYTKKNTKTDKDGIAIIKNYNDKKEKIKYIKVGNNNPLYVGIKNVSAEEYPNGYIYTDRQLYKNTDDINIFGYIPLKYFEGSNIVKDQFVLSIGEEKIPVTISDDGTFTTKYHLDNYKDSYMSITLKYKNETIASRYIEVKEYQKEMYDFKVDMDKDYVDAGKPFVFSVTITHISGAIVPNKEIQAVIDDKIIKAKTDARGVAKFSIPTTRSESDSTIMHSEVVNVKCSLTEAAQEGINVYYNVIDRYLTDTKIDYNQKKKEVDINIDTISTSKNISSINYISQLKDKPYSGNIKIELEETKYTKKITGYNYNEITKESEPDYEYETSHQTVSSNSYTIKNGNLKYKINYKIKNDTENINYSYELYMYLKDKNNNEVKFSRYISNSSGEEASKNGYLRYDYNPVSNESYNLYSYYMPEHEYEELYSVNAPIIRQLYSYKGQREISNNKFLLIKYKNSILDKKIFNKTESITSSFTDKDRPGVKITGAYLKDGNFYRLPTEYLDYNEKDSALDISIKPIKIKVKPQEEVTVKIKVTKKSKGIKSKVNVSVVDEGVFKASGDNTNILGEVYQDMYYNQYTFSTFRDYTLSINGGGKGSTAGQGRSDFGDTIYFKTVETDSSGNAIVRFKVNDSITSFRITAHATTSDVDVGDNYTNIESSLPVSISFTKPQGIKETDDVVLNAIGLGETKEEINYEFTIKETNNKVIKKGRISDNVYANLGKLKAGNYTAIISAKTSDYKDKVEYKFSVVKSQTEVNVKNTSSIDKNTKIKPTKNPIILEFYRSVYKDYAKYLEILKTTKDERLDVKYSYFKGLEYENKYTDSKDKPELGDISKFKEKTGYKYLAGEEVDDTLTAILSYYDSSLAFSKKYYYEKTKKEDVIEKMNAYINLAAQKEPILDDLKQLIIQSPEADDDQLALSYIFLGDYKSAKHYYDNITNEGLKTYLSTFIDKRNAKSNIDKLYSKDKSNRYLYFSIISYFENNNVDLSTKEDLTVYHESKKDKIEVPSLGLKKITIYQKDLDNLKIKSKYKDIYVNYYYDGLLDDIDKKHKVENIKCTLPNKTKLGSTISLKINIKNVNNNTTLNLYLPNGLTLGDGFRSDFAYIESSTKEKASIYIGEKKSDTIEIPLYASSPGEYVIEPIVLIKGNKYQISNSVKIKISE